MNNLTFLFQVFICLNNGICIVSFDVVILRHPYPLGAGPNICGLNTQTTKKNLHFFLSVFLIVEIVFLSKYFLSTCIPKLISNASFNLDVIIFLT